MRIVVLYIIIFAYGEVGGIDMRAAEIQTDAFLFIEIGFDEFVSLRSAELHIVVC